MMRTRLTTWMSRAIDLGRPTPRWVGWASRIWPQLAEDDRRMRELDARLRQTAQLELASTPIATGAQHTDSDGPRSLFVVGTGLAAAAAAAVALGVFIWRSNDVSPEASDPAALANATNPAQAVSEATQPLTDLLGRVHANAPDSLQAAAQLQDLAGFLLLDLPATDFDPINALRPSGDETRGESEHPDLVS